MQHAESTYLCPTSGGHYSKTDRNGHVKAQQPTKSLFKKSPMFRNMRVWCYTQVIQVIHVLLLFNPVHHCIFTFDFAFHTLNRSRYLNCLPGLDIKPALQFKHYPHVTSCLKTDPLTSSTTGYKIHYCHLIADKSHPFCKIHTNKPPSF